MREYSKDFEGKCCEDNFKVCDWTCEEISQRIRARAPLGTVYTRGQIDTMIATLNAKITAASTTQAHC